MLNRPAPRLSSPIRGVSASSGTSSSTTRLQFTPGPSATALGSGAPSSTTGGRGVPGSGGRLVMSQLTSPPSSAAPIRSPGRTGASGTQHASHINIVPSGSGESTYVWSPTRRGIASVAIRSPNRSASPAAYRMAQAPAASTVGASAMRSPLRPSSSGSALRSPTRDVASQSGSVARSSTTTGPTTSLLDSMSELRALIAKKEMELTSLAATRSSATTAFHASSSTSTSFASTVPIQVSMPTQQQAVGSPGRLKSVAYTYEPVGAGVSPSPSSSYTASLLSQSAAAQATAQQQFSSSFAATLPQHQSSPPAATQSHAHSLHDQEVHEYNLRILSLEQLLMDREEQYQTLKLEADRLKRREESLAADSEVHSLAHKKQVELLNHNLESLTWNRHDSLEKQREEFEHLRKEMMDELVKKDEIHNLKLQNLNQNLLNYEEQLRTQERTMDETRTQAKKEIDSAANTITTLSLEVESLKTQKSSAKDQLQTGIKQQLAMTSNLKSLSRKLEETQRRQEAERADFFALRSKLEHDAARAKTEAEARAEELLATLRGVENQLLENERTAASNLAQAERMREDQQLQHAEERERLLEEAHEQKRSMLEEFTSKVNDSSLALAAAQNHTQHLERDLQDQRQRLSHENALAQESWNNLVQEKERELQALRRELTQTQIALAQVREQNSSLDADVSQTRAELVGTRSDLEHARQSLEESHHRLGETRAAHKASDEEKQAGWHERLDDVQGRLNKAEREAEDNARALQVERLRTTELTAQLQLLRTSSQNKVRAIEVARSLEQQALLTDFASQLGRVRSEITAIKTQTPKDKQRDVNRSKRDRERERQAHDRETSRERSRERLRSPQPQSAATALGSPSSISSARRHVRVRSIDETPLHTGSQVFGNSRG